MVLLIFNHFYTYFSISVFDLCVSVCLCEMGQWTSMDANGILFASEGVRLGQIKCCKSFAFHIQLNIQFSVNEIAII